MNHAPKCTTYFILYDHIVALANLAVYSATCLATDALELLQMDTQWDLKQT